MLNQETKRKIDSARQILVGKVPDPKAQVEQITTALIYKFMDDMDKEAQELGGKSTFFTNGYEKYAWTKLMDPRLSGHERLDLYDEAINSLSMNPHIPQLFRDIFKDAFLPYRSPETLGLFLKEINGFTYEHSEDLGDAFEYLLSILGSQGDAGQFRTPRHIIDFIVAAVAPKKDETICDPACGTAGFLISAYKYILKQHNNSDDSENYEKQLTPDEKKNLMNHFVGYDISPDMVRLSKVNLYLHGFPTPTIFEYDTLSSEEKWDENFDVMLANPPFMSPKGGITPHKRFSVQANRSEVLFVDYILEHLRPNGRAGIIVPEGIIFQSANAYKALRKLLLEDGLLAVVSLPAGVFNPYAGVKTSILLFDNNMAKKAKEILFLKIQNDGFDLGAQRREIDKNDLPLALEIVKKYKTALKESKKFELNGELAKIAHLVAKDKIAESDDNNLSGDRYKVDVGFTNKKWPMVKLGDVILDMKDGGTPSRKNPEYFGGDICWCVVKDIKPEIYDTAEKLNEFGLKNSSAKVWPTDSIIISLGATIGNIGITKVPTATKQGLSGILVDKNKVLPEFLAMILKSKKEYIKSLATGVTIREIRPSRLKELFIFPLPPLEVQKEIVEQIEIKQKAIEAAKAVIENLERERRYFGQSLRKLEDVEWVELGEISERITKGTTPTTIGHKFENMGINFIKIESITEGGGLIPNKIYYITKKCHEELKRSQLKENDLLFSIAGAFGRVSIIPKWVLPANTNQALAIISLKSDIYPKFIFNFLKSDLILEEIGKLKVGVAQYNVSLKQVSKLKIPLPPLETQKKLVAEIEELKGIIETNKKLIRIMEQKIANVLSEI
jgi:type I restriction enzyme M protein